MPRLAAIFSLSRRSISPPEPELVFLFPECDDTDHGRQNGLMAKFASCQPSNFYAAIRM